MIATRCAPVISDSANGRPDTSAIPITEKYCELTVRVGRLTGSAPGTSSGTDVLTPDSGRLLTTAAACTPGTFWTRSSTAR